MTPPVLTRPEIAAVAERTRDALESTTVDSEAANDYAAARGILESSGLTAIRVPASAGGTGANQTETLAAVRILAQADPGIAQLLQPQFAFTDAIAALPEHARGTLYAAVLDGARFGNAASERGGRHSADFRSTLHREGERYLLRGRKYYATGSVGASWLTVIAANADGAQALAYLPANADGVRIIDDWNGLGQRGSGSGSAVFDEVEVDPAYVIDPWDADHRPIAWHETGRFVHAAIDVGIAQGALRYGLASVLRDPDRIPFELPYSSLLEDPTLRTLIGRLSARTRAVAALLRESTALLDRVQSLSDPAQNAARRSALDGAWHGELHGELQGELAEALSATKALSADLALEASSAVFEWTGARQAAASLRADRFWRNARTHTLHDPVRLRYEELGSAELRSAELRSAEPGLAEPGATTNHQTEVGR